MDDGFAVGEVAQYFVHLVADSRAQVTPGRVVATDRPKGRWEPGSRDSSPLRRFQGPISFD